MKIFKTRKVGSNKYINTISMGINTIFFIFFLNLSLPLHKLLPDHILNLFPELKYINIFEYGCFFDNLKTLPLILIFVFIFSL